MWQRSITIAIGAVLTLVMGLVGTFVPVAGNLFGPLVGGMAVGVHSPEDRPSVDGSVAALLGGVGPAVPLFITLRTLWAVPSVPGPSVLGVPAAAVVGLATVCGVVGALGARYHPEGGRVHPAVRDGT